MRRVPSPTRSKRVSDLTDEEWTPKDAGTAKRIDFMSASAALAIGVKMVRGATHAKAIADELRQDFESYYVHESCRTLVVFVYDPRAHRPTLRPSSATYQARGRSKAEAWM